MEEEASTPGLRWRRTRTGRTPMWRASKEAIAAGYPVKTANLSALSGDALAQRCQRLQAEMRDWMAGRKGRTPFFDGTIAALLEFYLTDQESPYRALKPSSRHPYDVYARMLKAEVGKRRIDACDGRDLRRWFAAWSEPATVGGKPRLAAARMAMTVLKTSLSFGKTCRLAGCAAFKSIMDEIEFPVPAPRVEAPSASDVIAARAAAHVLGHSAAALAYALQFEATLRQWDVVGEWIPLNDRRPSALIDGTSKWIGPTWGQIDANLILRITPTKTEDKGAARVSIDLKSCPMVVEELARVPAEHRVGPLIVNPRTKLPYRQGYFRSVWDRCAAAAGMSPSVWNRDLRAGGITEARAAGAPTDDVAKTAGHASKRTTARVYDRAALEAARRVSHARNAHRAGGKDE